MAGPRRPAVHPVPRPHRDLCRQPGVDDHRWHPARQRRAALPTALPTATSIDTPTVEQPLHREGAASTCPMDTLPVDTPRAPLLSCGFSQEWGEGVKPGVPGLAHSAVPGGAEKVFEGAAGKASGSTLGDSVVSVDCPPWMHIEAVPRSRPKATYSSKCKGLSGNRLCVQPLARVVARPSLPPTPCCVRDPWRGGRDTPRSARGECCGGALARTPRLFCGTAVARCGWIDAHAGWRVCRGDLQQRSRRQNGLHLDRQHRLWGPPRLDAPGGCQPNGLWRASAAMGFDLPCGRWWQVPTHSIDRFSQEFVVRSNPSPRPQPNTRSSPKLRRVWVLCSQTFGLDHFDVLLAA